MSQRVRFFKVTTETAAGRAKTTRTAVWNCWAENYTANSTRKPAGLETLQEGEAAFEVRRCETAEAIRRALTRHEDAYEVDLDGLAYTLRSASYTGQNRAKIAFRAECSV